MRCRVLSSTTLNALELLLPPTTFSSSSGRVPLAESTKGMAPQNPLAGFVLLTTCAPRKQRETNELVAIKICEIDKADYTESSPTHRDETIKQLVKETSILQQLRDSSAGNVNKFYASFAFHSQLWMITEYVAGGSVRTLMRATPGGTPQRPMPLEEHFIIPIAREVAKGLKSVHDAGILHRDIKCRCTT